MLVILCVAALILVAAYVGWASRGDVCHGLVAMRSSLAKGHGFLTNVQGFVAAPVRPVATLVVRRISNDVLDPMSRVLYGMDAAAATTLMMQHEVSTAIFDTFDAFIDFVVRASSRFVDPAARMLQGLDVRCAARAMLPQQKLPCRFWQVGCRYRERQQSGTGCTICSETSCSLAVPCP